MRKILSLMIFIAAMGVISCDKDKEEDNGVSRRDMLMGIWEENDSELDGCTSLIKFSESLWFEGDRCGGANEFYDGISYQFDNNNKVTFEYYGAPLILELISLTSTQMKAKIIWDGDDQGTYDYTKIN